MSHISYAARILKFVGMLICNPCQTPMEVKLKLSKNKEDEVVDPTAYRSLIGSLRYIVNTRPDLAHSVGSVSRFMEAPPNKEHWIAVKHIQIYLKGTIGYGSKYERGAGYSDSNFFNPF